MDEDMRGSADSVDFLSTLRQQQRRMESAPARPVKTSRRRPDTAEAASHSSHSSHSGGHHSGSSMSDLRSPSLPSIPLSSAAHLSSFSQRFSTPVQPTRSDIPTAPMTFHAPGPAGAAAASRRPYDHRHSRGRSRASSSFESMAKAAEADGADQRSVSASIEDFADDDLRSSQALSLSLSTESVRTVVLPACVENPYLNDSTGLMTGETSLRLKTVATNVSQYLRDFHEIAVIGRGETCDVFKTRSRSDGCFYAIKRSKPSARPAFLRMKQEALALAALSDCPYIVRYYSSWVADDCCYMQLELCEGSLESRAGFAPRRGAHYPTASSMDLDDIDMSTGRTSVDAPVFYARHAFSETELMSVICHICQALWVMHSRGMVHLDVKPANILYAHVPDTMRPVLRPDTDGIPMPSRLCVYKLADLGQVVLINKVMTVEEGDARYLPPEILEEDVSNLPAADIFSLGASIYELALGQRLPTGGQEYSEIRSGRLAPLHRFSAEFVELLRSMMAHESWKRPTAATILATYFGAAIPSAETIFTPPSPVPNHREPHTPLSGSARRLSFQTPASTNYIPSPAQRTHHRPTPMSSAFPSPAEDITTLEDALAVLAKERAAHAKQIERLQSQLRHAESARRPANPAGMFAGLPFGSGGAPATAR